MTEAYDYSVCANCGVRLPEKRAWRLGQQDRRPSFDGFCTEECRAAWHARYALRTATDLPTGGGTDVEVSN